MTEMTLQELWEQIDNIDRQQHRSPGEFTIREYMNAHPSDRNRRQVYDLLEGLVISGLLKVRYAIVNGKNTKVYSQKREQNESSNGSDS